MIQAWSSWKRRHGTYRFWNEQTSRCHEIQGDLLHVDFKEKCILGKIYFD